MNKRYCLECASPIGDALRHDAKFCSPSCRSNYKKKRDRLLETVEGTGAELAALRKGIAFLESDAALVAMETRQLAAARAESEAALVDLRRKAEKELSKVHGGSLLGLAVSCFVYVQKNDMAKVAGIIGILASMGIGADEASRIFKWLQKESGPWEKRLKQVAEREAYLEKSLMPPIKKGLAEKRKLAAEKQASLRQLVIDHPAYLLEGHVPGGRPEGRLPATAGRGSIKGSEIMRMEFETFKLGGRLGGFLGELNRDMLAIGLVGDPGAGKSTLSYAIVQLFEKAGFSTAYFTLEMGIAKPVQSGLMRFPLRDTVFSTTGGLDALRQAAATFDVVAVDSFGKTGGKQEDIDALRNAFPHTVFLFIFQKTTKGTSRGGAGVDFDCSMVIDVVIKNGQRTALMRKSRYGTQGRELLLEGLENEG